MKRFQDLELMEKSGDLWGLKRQVAIPMTVNEVFVGNYIADFWYETASGAVVEDVKGVRTPLYKLKKRIVEALYGFEITEL